MLFDDIPFPRTDIVASIFAGSPTHSVPACAGLLLRLDTERLLWGSAGVLRITSRSGLRQRP